MLGLNRDVRDVRVCGGVRSITSCLYDISTIPSNITFGYVKMSRNVTARMFGIKDEDTALKFLYLFDSKTKFIDHFQLDDTLVEWTSTWTFEDFAGSFVYHYTVSQLQKKNSVLTAYHWKKIFNFSLNPSCSKMIFSILEDNNFSRASKKTKHY